MPSVLQLTLILLASGVAGVLIFRYFGLPPILGYLAIGVLIGAVATWAVGAFAGWQVSMTLHSIVLAAGFSALVGVFFWFYPAKRASELLPIQALRHE